MCFQHCTDNAERMDRPESQRVPQRKGGNAAPEFEMFGIHPQRLRQNGELKREVLNSFCFILNVKECENRRNFAAEKSKWIRKGNGKRREKPATGSATALQFLPHTHPRTAPPATADVPQAAPMFPLPQRQGATVAPADAANAGKGCGIPGMEAAEGHNASSTHR